MVYQRDIVEVILAEGLGNHPAIVISNHLVMEMEYACICVMMTSKDKNDEFSFKITDDMLIKPMGTTHCEARCQLINYVPINSIIRNRHNNQIKLAPFKKLLKKINSTTFSTEEL